MMTGAMMLRLMLAWQRHVDRRDLAAWKRDASCG